ncbi:MAG: hypothetical protein SFX73_30765 [Kofleriaceae bacterium]|nr:hypothetical protein [Kofleriaceae bacterium]
MRAPISIAVAVAALLPACSKGANEGAEEARKEAEAELKAKVAAGEAPKKISPPVPGQAKIPCAQLIDTAAFQTALGETEPLVLSEKKDEAEAAASCSLNRGGKPLSQTEQAAKLKKEGRLGVLPGDEVCNVSAFCWTIEEPERFKTKCAEKKHMDDESMGTYACRQTVMVGAFDVYVYRFFDADTKCVLQVRGGPSNTDNETIRKCAMTARDSIGPAQIAVSGATPPAAPAETK